MWEKGPDGYEDCVHVAIFVLSLPLINHIFVPRPPARVELFLSTTVLFFQCPIGVLRISSPRVGP